MRNDTKQAAYGRARRHSFAVAFLKRALPLTAFAVVGGFAAAALMSAPAERTGEVRQTGAPAGEIVMANPRLDGTDRNDRPFALKAGAARQVTSQPAVVSLDAIDATLPTDDGTFASIDAVAGVYDTRREVLTLSDGVTVRDLKGLDMDLRNARFDMEAGTMESDAPVEVRSVNADIDADSMRVLESGKRILFSNRVRMVIHNDKPSDKSALIGDGGSSTAPWVHTNKLSVAKFAVPAPDLIAGDVRTIKAGN